METPAKDTLILATSNAGKTREFSRLLAPLGLKILNLKDFPHLPEVEENGSTFLENARIKAEHACAGTGMPAVADDSGLEVEALGGLPGVRSARFSLPERAEGPEEARDKDEPWNSPACAALSRDERNNAKILALMEGLPREKRRGRYVCALAAVAPNGAHIAAQGFWEGFILEEGRGKNGFGYDPLFFDPELGRSAAEISLRIKNARSHRAMALRQLLKNWPAFRIATGK
ncbi:MAG: RdgB/HAM1 family non-canonical purine NTP pyrophosphatase [Desulfovibrionaceae bacterium]|nr:RdgB/HAM1 family non-canonical purine NTP pyrophosphatase [Desulfovibrionaceae bacterium]